MPARWRTLTLSVARMTVAALTPGTAFTAFSTWATQDAHVIPATPGPTVTSDIPYPAPSTARTTAPASGLPVNAISASPVARLTPTFVPFGSLAIAFSTWATHDATDFPRSEERRVGKAL